MPINDPLIGQKLGDYIIQDAIGSGGMARVYKGYDEKLDRHAAIKVIEPHLIASEFEEEYRERFLREARAIARLNHPNIVGIYQFGQYENLYYMAMAFIEGKDLRQILKEHNQRGERISEEMIISVIRDIANALDYAHSQGVIHRDVKPSNIMVQPDGLAVLTDFGLALNAVEGTVGNTFGSVHYIAPEQAVSSAQAVPQSDMYSLGVVLYEMLTGRVPFEDASAMSVALKHISDPPPPPSHMNPDISPAVEQVVVKALDKTPQLRFESGAAFADALEAAFKGVGTATTKPAMRAATPVTSGETSPTLHAVEGSMPSSSDPSRPSQPDAMQPRSRWPAMIFVGIVIAVILIGSLLLIDNANRNANATATAVAFRATSTADAIIAATGTQSAIDAATATQDAIDAATATQNAIDAATATAQARQTATAAANATATAEARATATAAANATATVVEAARQTATAEAIATATGIARLAQTATAQAAEIATEMAIIDATSTALAVPIIAATATFTPSPTMTPSPTLTPTQIPRVDNYQPGDAQVLLLYDGRTLVLINRDPENNVNISPLYFVQDRENEDGQVEEIVFDVNQGIWTSSGFDLRAVPPLACYQTWTLLHRNLPRTDPPADVCRSRRGTGQTSRDFWLNEDTSVTFRVMRGSDVLAVCPTQRPESFTIRSCAVDVRRR
ncbi:MAG: serine/threonine protein kinase [Chloroflexi bacterium]|nr:MAG: serine/threonine protein kinase [Chloroflexota bacterium]